MIAILRTKYLTRIALIFTFFLPFATDAQQGQILSVTPPLFQISVEPGDIWQSNVKVVNGNPYELYIYAEVVNFAPQGENGRGKLIPLLGQEDQEATLAEWIEINEGPHIIPPEQSKEISFFVDVPENASPGGHFAAILIGTKPPEDSENQLVVHTSQTVTSLFFVRIEGDVIEVGDIREFSTVDNFVPDPHAEFVLRFQNKGNVHLQPRGYIIIRNMWGKERGAIPINQQSHYGNVLPESIREFKFEWTGEKSITEIGRYQAEATLAYGEEGIKSVTQYTSFWVVPVKATLITIVSTIAFILFIAWMIKLYVRRMLVLAGVDVEEMRREKEEEREGGNFKIEWSRYKDYLLPITKGLRELREQLRDRRQMVDFVVTLYEFGMHYKVFFGAVMIISIGFVIIVLFISSASQEQRSYEVIIENEDGSTIVDSEEIIKDRLTEEIADEPIGELEASEQNFILQITNATGEAGRAAEIALSLEEKGYRIDSLDTYEGDPRTITLIEYDRQLEAEAQELFGVLTDTILTELQYEESDIPEVPIIKILLGSKSVVE